MDATDDTPLALLAPPVRVRNTLPRLLRRRGKKETLGEALALEESDLIQIPYFGRDSRKAWMEFKRAYQTGQMTGDLIESEKVDAAAKIHTEIAGHYAAIGEAKKKLADLMKRGA